MVRPLVSIIVPVYQVEKYLERCINSILNQSYTNIEVILIDDGSTDKSLEICEKYKRKDKRIKVVHQVNSGVAVARNTGIKEAKGKWYCFVDPDDYLADDYIEYLLRLCLDYHAEMSCCMYEIVYEKMNKINMPVKQEVVNTLTIYTPEKFTYLLLCDKVGNYLWNKMFSESLWKDIRLNEEMKIYEDLTVVYKLAAKCNKIVYGNNIKYFYFQREKSLLHEDTDMRNITLYFQVLNDQENYVKINDIKLIKPVPFDLLRLENYRRYLNYCIAHEIKINAVDTQLVTCTKNKLLVLKLFLYADIFDKKSIFSNILLLISRSFYFWQRKKRSDITKC